MSTKTVSIHPANFYYLLTFTQSSSPEDIINILKVGFFMVHGGLGHESDIVNLKPKNMNPKPRKLVKIAKNFKNLNNQ